MMKSKISLHPLDGTKYRSYGTIVKITEQYVEIVEDNIGIHHQFSLSNGKPIGRGSRYYLTSDILLLVQKSRDCIYKGPI